LQVNQSGEDVFISGTLDLFVTAMREPMQPMMLVLSKKAINKQIESETAISSFSANPNPFENLLNVAFSLLKTEKVTLKITSEEGKLCYFSAKTELEQGDYLFPIKLDVPAGVYMVTLVSEHEIKTIKVIKP
jgi:hypothetical protein